MVGQVWRELPVRDAGRDDEGPEQVFGAHGPNAAVRAGLALARRTVPQRGVFRARVARLLTALNGGRIDIRFRGAAFRLTGERNLIEYGVLLDPNYNGFEIDFLLRDAPPDACFVDIGCNVGSYALSLAAARPEGRVLAIDANPRMVRQLERNARLGGGRNLRALPVAVSDAAGKADLAICNGDAAMVSIVERGEGAVPVQPLADLLAAEAVGRIDGLKIDIAGHEDRALAPFLAAAPDAALPRRIVIGMPEWGVDYPACLEAMFERGYLLDWRTRTKSCWRLD